MKDRAFLIIKANSAEEAERFTKDRFAPGAHFDLEWSEWCVQGETPESLQDGSQWSMLIKFPSEQVLDVGCVLGKWFTEPGLGQLGDSVVEVMRSGRNTRMTARRLESGQLGDSGYPVGTLLYYAPYDRVNN